jgi:hypothetical protein
MFSDLYPLAKGYHDEYTRRHVNPLEPPEQPRHNLKRAIGHSLIHLGERLAELDNPQSVDRAA